MIENVVSWGCSEPVVAVAFAETEKKEGVRGIFLHYVKIINVTERFRV
jgi:hypothetical protein